MKKTVILTTLTKPKNLVITIGIILLVPFAYALNQNTQFDSMTKNITSTQLDEEKETSTIPEVKFMKGEKVRKGIVQNVDTINNSLTIKIGNELLYVENNATTTYYFGGGEIAMQDDVSADTKIYVFGYLKSDNSLMSASKIVIANKSKLTRK